MRNVIAALTATIAIMIWAVPAGAANLIVNGGFETGNLAGFSLNATATAVAPSGFTGLNAHSGAYFLAMGDVTTTYPFGVISQTVTDTAGETLTLSYWLASAGGTPNFFEALWNGAVIPGSTVTNIGPQDYTFFEFDVLGTGTDILSFHERNLLAYSALDDISLEGTGVTPPVDPGVPEPGSASMVAFALLALAALRRAQGKSRTGHSATVI
jgi:hypothetical protein